MDALPNIRSPIGSGSKSEETKKPKQKPKGEHRRYNLARIASLRNLLISAWRHELRDKQLTGPVFDRCLAIAKIVLPADIELTVLETSLSTTAGEVFTNKLIAQTACRLAGNLPRLRERYPALPWTTQRFNEWVPVQITAVRFQRGGKRREPGIVLTAWVMAGTPCPLSSEKWWSLKQCRLYSSNLGFAAPWRNPAFTLRDPRQFVNLRMEVLFEPEKCKDRLWFEYAEVPSAMVKWNKERIKYRARLEPKYACPHNKPDSQLCHFCEIGYERCPAAVHRKDFVVGICEVCEKTAFIDPELPGICVNCRTAYRHDKH